MRVNIRGENQSSIVSIKQVPITDCQKVKSFESCVSSRSDTLIMSGYSVTMRKSRSTSRERAALLAPPRDFTSAAREKSPFEIGDKPDKQVASSKAIIDKAAIMDISGGVTNVDEYINLFFTDFCALDKASCADISEVKIVIVEEDEEEAAREAEEAAKAAAEAQAQAEAEELRSETESPTGSEESEESGSTEVSNLITTIIVVACKSLHHH